MERQLSRTNRLGLRQLFLAAGLFAAAAGCMSLDHAKLQWDDKPAHGEISQVMVLWADGVVVHPDPMNNGAPTPGIAGRVYLFGPKLGDPLAGQGTLTVQLHDDMQPQNGQRVPREIWNIDQDSLDRVLKKDSLGWGYDLWLPWRNYHPEIKKVMLLVKYQPKDEGKPAWSANMTLAVGGSGRPKTASTLRTTTAGKS